MDTVASGWSPELLALIQGEHFSKAVVLDATQETPLGAVFGSQGHRTAGIPWGALLFPTLALPELQFPDRIWEVYRSVQWDAPLTGHELEVDVETEYVSGREDSIEVGITTSARTNAGATARAQTILRLDGTALSFGQRTLPSRPTTSRSERGYSLVVDQISLETYCSLVNMRHPSVDSPTSAFHQGLPNQLAPSGLLIAAALRGKHAACGRVQVWFDRPIPAGAIVNIGEWVTPTGVGGILSLAGQVHAASFLYEDLTQSDQPIL